MLSTTYTADGVTTDFLIGLGLIDEAHIRVIVNKVLKTKGTDYNVQDKVGGQGKIIHFATAPANTLAIEIYRNVPISAVAKLNPTISHIEERQALEAVQDRLSDIVEKNFYFGQVALLAGTAIEFIAPFDGYFESIETAVNKAITTGGTITPAVETVTVAGAVVTIANAAIVGAKQLVPPTTAHSTTTKFRKGQRITLTPASFATAGEVSGLVRLQAADF